MNVNCRKDELCMFCKHWVGSEPDIDFRTGKGKASDVQGCCAYMSSKEVCWSTEVCSRFEKSILYV